MKILFYFKNKDNLQSKNLAGIEALNLSLFRKIKKINSETYLVNSLNNNIIKKKWDCVISSNSATLKVAVCDPIPVCTSSGGASFLIDRIF